MSSIDRRLIRLHGNGQRRAGAEPESRRRAAEKTHGTHVVRNTLWGVGAAPAAARKCQVGNATVPTAKNHERGVYRVPSPQARAI